ncbi:hypothetical protein BJ322DRAFT_1083578 [Thelephora terrestris]|uniref:Alpha-galactosidase n=1 Tax=Thelephora terrestris TaxID=56493 RepID=A0A9P6H780_9AGAM|nr:hypothetical protein BJ322DRAFT_1083578 [Thelephora terrestris]
MVIFPSSFAVALLNTSPEEHVIDVSFTDIFKDMDKYWWEATYTVNDLWEKDGQGEWRRSLGTMLGGIRGALLQPTRQRSGSWFRFLSHNASVEGTRVAIFLEFDSVYHLIDEQQLCADRR